MWRCGNDRVGLKPVGPGRVCARAGCVLFSLFFLVALGTLGCKETEPPAAYNYDLGDGKVSLPPTSAVHVDFRLADGRADWPAFRDPAAAPPPNQQDKPAVPSGAESELRELVQEYNEFVAEATVDDLLEYFASDQHNALRPWLKIALASTVKLAAVGAQLAAKLPDAQDQFAKTLAWHEGKYSPKLSIGSITIKGATEAVGTASAGSSLGPIRFVLDEEDWYFEVLDPDRLAGMSASAAEAVTMYEQCLTDLASGDRSAEQVMEQLASDVASDAPADKTNADGAETEDNDDPAKPKTSADGPGGG